MPGNYGLQSNAPLQKIIKCVTAVIAIANFAVAANYRNACPKEPFISLHLGGYSFIALILLPFSICGIYLRVTAVCLICWLITGSIKIYSIYEPSYNDLTVDTYCKVLYLYAFWSTNFTYVLLFGFFVLSVFDYFFAPFGVNN